jgi:membrane-bound lytic murein transglycosylase A
LSIWPFATHAARSHHPHLPYPQIDWPFEIAGGQYSPVSWGDVAGWYEDDQLRAFNAFRASCRPITAQDKPAAESRALGLSLRAPCRAAKIAEITDAARARAFFEAQFVPLRVSRLGEAEGFVTGYYEPVIEGSRTQTDVYTVPVYRRPSNLFVRGVRAEAVGLPNKGQVFRKIGRRKLVPYYDRAEIEDGAVAGRGLEICWLKNQTDLLFAQIQGSARVRLEDGSTLRINYDAHNGFPYTPVGRILIERNIIPRDQMSMHRIREWMEQNPDGANELRRQNRSYVFFREVALSDRDEAVGAQGVPLTPGRSIAVDKSLHVYGTPFFIEGELPIESEQSKTPFRRLMIAQDTGSAIVGPARADLYFGAGVDAGKVSGRLRHGMRFVMLVPKSLDPVTRGHSMPVPVERPSARIAKLFPQADPGKAVAATAVAQAAQAVPLPAARPEIAPDRPARRYRHHRPYRHQR